MQKNIIIAGAGFGGLTLALKLSKKMGRLGAQYKIILIDRHHHQLYTPALYEIASIPKETAPDENLKTSVLISIKDAVEGTGIEFLCDEIVGLKRGDKKIVLKKSGELNYEYLALALGSETNYFNIPGLKKYSLPIKTFNDGVGLRNAIENVFLKQGHLKIVVGGAGSNGVELVAESVNFVCKLHKKIFSAKGGSASGGKKKVCSAEFMLIEASQEILPGFEIKTVKKTRKRLESIGVKIKTGVPITSVTPKELIFQNDSRESYDILVWTGGVKGPVIFGEFDLPLSPKGALIADEYLRAGGEDKIFAIGDNSSFIHHQTKKPLPWNIPVAEAESRITAKNILRSICGKSLKKYKPLKKYPFILAVGRKYSIADLLLFSFSGFFGWFLKQLVELRYLLFILPFNKAVRTWFEGLKLFTSND